MQGFVEDLQLSPRWWWGIVAAIVVVALIFLAAGSKTAMLVCLIVALAVGLLARSVGGFRADGQRSSSRS